MSQKETIVKRLTEKLDVLRADSRFRVRALNRRAKSDGFTWQGIGARSAIKDDHIIILGLAHDNKKLSLAFKFNYIGKSIAESSVVATVRYAYQTEARRGRDGFMSYVPTESRLLSSKAYGYEEFKEKLIEYIDTLKKEGVKDLVSDFIRIMEIKDEHKLKLV